MLMQATHNPLKDLKSDIKIQTQVKILEGKILNFRRRDVIDVSQGQLWEIEKGFVKTISWDAQGCLITLGIWGPGELLGLPLGKIQPFQIICISPVRIRLAQQNGDYPYEFIWNQAQQAQELLHLFRCRCLQERIYNLLWWLAGRFGTRLASGRLTGIHLTHQELADLSGSTRVTVTRLLSQLEEEEKLERRNRHFLLKSSF